jgi:secondary thiamine-phosphate synthase enzyme
MPVVQRHLELAPVPRGVHLITREIVAAMPELRQFRVGLAHVFIQHTSASLALNESASPDVRRDLDRWLDDAVPGGWDGFEHVDEGADDMPAHVKAILIGPSLTMPIANGALALGTWQGIYLCEHRDRGGPRSLVVTLSGE